MFYFTISRDISSQNFISRPTYVFILENQCNFEEETYKRKTETMPTLNWIGKDKVVTHHQNVPFHVLEHKYGFTAKNGKQNTATDSGNMIIHGDNLVALKSLLPQFEGRIDCIYIDPPYNTGNEGWIYNDNVNDPHIKKWLGEVVGKQGEDLSRHDKWLCMMYPRLKLLSKLLAEKGLIFISIDDNEYQYLRVICNEIFGLNNFVTNFTWRTEGNFDNQAKIKINHEYILCFAKNIDYFETPEIIDPNIGENSKLFNFEIRNTIVKNGPKNPISEIILPAGFPADFKEGIIKARCDIWPHYLDDAIIKDYKLQEAVKIQSGWSSKKILINFIEKSFNSIKDTKGQDTIFVITETGAIENIKKREKSSHVISSLYNMGSTQSMSNELNRMGITFDYPKPAKLIKYIISLINGNEYTVLDCFAGSGTTAHAIMDLNKTNNGNRKFILIEMMDYAETITAERIKRVMTGYDFKGKVEEEIYSQKLTLKNLLKGEEVLKEAEAEIKANKGKYDKISKPKIVDNCLKVVGTKTYTEQMPGLGGAFDYYELGKPLFDKYGFLNEEVGIEKIREYIFYSETQQPIENGSSESYMLGNHNHTDYYLYYKQGEETTFEPDTLNIIQRKADSYIVYADTCLFSKDELIRMNIMFKKIPRDIHKF